MMTSMIPVHQRPHWSTTCLSLPHSVTSSESAVWSEYQIGGVSAKRYQYANTGDLERDAWPVVLMTVYIVRQNL